MCVCFFPFCLNLKYAQSVLPFYAFIIGRPTALLLLLLTDNYHITRNTHLCALLSSALMLSEWTTSSSSTHFAKRIQTEAEQITHMDVRMHICGAFERDIYIYKRMWGTALPRLNLKKMKRRTSMVPQTKKKTTPKTCVECSSTHRRQLKKRCLGTHDVAMRRKWWMSVVSAVGGSSTTAYMNDKARTTTTSMGLPGIYIVMWRKSQPHQ